MENAISSSLAAQWTHEDWQYCHDLCFAGFSAMAEAHEAVRRLESELDLNVGNDMYPFEQKLKLLKEMQWEINSVINGMTKYKVEDTYGMR